MALNNEKNENTRLMELEETDLKESDDKSVQKQRQAVSNQTAVPLKVTGSNIGNGRENPFAKSLKLLRSPPTTPTGEPSKGLNKKSVQTSIKRVFTDVLGGKTDDVLETEQQTSPKRTYISKMRKEEEKMLNSCKSIIEKMKAAAKRQTNISNDVKTGLMVLEEAIDVIVDYRTNWKAAELQLQNEAAVQQRQPEAKIALDTPTPSGSKKRPASSPAEKKEEKRVREDGPKEGPTEEWTTQESRKKRRQKRKEEKGKQQIQTEKAAADPTPSSKKPKGRPRKSNRKREDKPRSDALLIRPAKDLSYADVLGEIKLKVKPEDTEIEIKAIRQTRSGSVLLELGAESKNKEGFCNVLRGVLGDKAKVNSLEPRVSIEIRDLDCCTEKAEVEAALRRDIPEIGDVRVHVTAPNPREQKVALVEMSDKMAMKLLTQGKIKIGWVNCRVRKRTAVERCFRCLGYGHVVRACKGPDRTNLCYKCGKAGHKRKECTSQEHCALCSERALDQAKLAHVLGSGNCVVFREALEIAKKRR